MTGQAILTEIIGILVGGITGIAEGIGSGLSVLAESIFLQGSGDSQTLSIFGVLIVVFAGVALAINLSRLCVRWLSSLGGSRM